MKLDRQFFRPPHMKLLLASSLAINLLSLALPLMTMQIYDRVMANRAEETLMVLSIGVLIAAAAELCLRIARQSVVSKSAAECEHQLTDELLDRIIKVEPRQVGEIPSSALLEYVNAAPRLKEYYGGQMAASLLVDLPFVLIFLCLSAYLAGILAIVPCAILGIYGTISWHQGKRLKSAMDKKEEEDESRYTFITQTLKAIHSTKALCLEAITVRRFEEIQRGSGMATINAAMVQGETSNTSYTLGQLMTVAVVCVGAPMVVYGHLTVGMLVATIMLSGQIMQPLQRGLSLWMKLQDITIARGKMQHVLGMKERNWHTLEELKPNHAMVKLDNVRFSYIEGQPILDGISLDIQPGETMAILGPSGSGKTTMLELLAGLYAPDKGRLLVSGMEPSRIPPAERARYIAYLQNRGLIMRGSIMDNLTGFDPRRQKEAQHMAELFGISEAVALLPAGYDTQLDGLATDVISPGLKQRIAMGRALLSKPRLILYDNADQGLDRESYAGVFSLLARLKQKATLVLVSEDKNILSLADRVVELHQTQVVPMMEPLPLTARHTNIVRLA